MDRSCSKYISKPQNGRRITDGRVPDSDFVVSCQENNRVSLEDLFNPLIHRKPISSLSQRPTRSDGQGIADSDGSSKSPIFMVGPEKLRAKPCSKDGRTDEIPVLAGESERRLQRASSEESESSCDDPSTDSLSHILRAAIKIKPSSHTNIFHNNTFKMSSPRSINSRNMPRRSRAIAIQRPPPQYDHMEEEAMSQAENERLYDFATWRMYSRIVDHRRNQVHYSTKSQHSISGDEAAVSPTCVRQTTVPEAIMPKESSLDGEVFEFDF